MKKRKNIKRRFQSTFLWCVLGISCFAQTPQVDHLRERLARYPDNDTVRANVIIKIAGAYNEVNKDSMFHYSRLLLDEARQSGNSWQMAQANKMMGMYWQSIQPGESIEYLRRAYETFKAVNNKAEMVTVNLLISSSFHRMGDYEKQLSHLKKALQDVLEINNKKLEISVLHNVSEAYYCLKNYKLAEEYSSMALQESRRNDGWMLNPIMTAQAGIEYQKGNYQRSVELSEVVLIRAREKKQIQMEIACLNNIAECRIKIGQYKEANRILGQSRRLTNPEEHSADYYRNLQLTVALDSATGNFQHAFKTQRDIEQLMSRKNSLEQIRNASNIALQTELQRLSMRLSNLVLIYQEKEKQSAKMNVLIIFLAAIIFGGTALLFWARQSLKKLNIERERLVEAQKLLSEKKKKMSGNRNSLYLKKDLLKESNDDLELSDRSKTELFKTISHDLQKPLVELQQKLTELMISDIDEAQFRMATSGLSSSVGNMSLLLENLLLWSKFQSRSIKVKPQYTEIITLINDVIGQQKYSAAEKSAGLINALEHRLYVYADEELIKCLLKTILQNTIKLSELGATITILGNKNQRDGWIQINYKGHMALKDMYLQLSEINDYDAEQSELGKAISLGWMLCRTLAEVNNGYYRIENVSDEFFDIYLYFPLEEPASKKS